MTARKIKNRLYGGIIMIAFFCGISWAAAPAHAESPQDRRNRSVAMSIYNTGKHSAAQWGQRSALSLCTVPLDDNEAQADARDEAPNLEDFRDWIRDAYGTHYERYQNMIDPLLDLPEHEEKFKLGQDWAAQRLIDTECAPFFTKQLEEETEKSLTAARTTMERMARTLSPH